MPSSCRSYRSHLTALTTISTLPCFSFPGSQLYHSTVCILVQFLMLRLMGRTVTTVLSSFTFQMVRHPNVSSSLLSSFLRAQACFLAAAPLCCSASGAAHQFVCTFFTLISAAAVCDFLCFSHELQGQLCPLMMKSHASCRNIADFIFACSCILGISDSCFWTA